MTPDPIRDYQAAKKAYDEVTRKVDEMVKGLGRIHQRLDHGGWRSVAVVGVSGFPSELLARPATGYGGPINPSDLPTVQELGSTLLAWHEAARQLKATWARVPESDRYGIQGPTP